jgi:hypothetical protein
MSYARYAPTPGFDALTDALIAGSTLTDRWHRYYPRELLLSEPTPPPGGPAWQSYSQFSDKTMARLVAFAAQRGVGERWTVREYIAASETGSHGGATSKAIRALRENGILGYSRTAMRTG